MTRLLTPILSLALLLCVAADRITIDIDGQTRNGTVTWDAPPTQPPPVQPTTAPVPPVILVPQLPSMTVRTAPPGNGPRGDGFRIPPAQTTASAFVADGWEQNIVVENHPLPTTLTDFWSLRAHKPTPEKPGTFKGQLLYADKCGPLTIREYYARTAGKWPGMRPQDVQRFYHGGYFNFGVQSLTIEDSWLEDAACAAIQSRGPVATVRRCFMSANGIALLAVGRVKVESCTVYGGSTYYFPPDPATGKPASWAGDNGVQAYYPVDLTDVWFVGKPGQGDSVTSIPGLKTYHLGCIVSGGDYSKPEWKPPVGADGKRITKLITAKDCVIAGWPGPAFAGSKPHDGSGFTVKPGAVDVSAQIDAIRAQMEARQITTAEAVRQAQAVVRGGVR